MVDGVRVVRMGLPNCFIVRGQISVILRCLVLPLASVSPLYQEDPHQIWPFHLGHLEL